MEFVDVGSVTLFLRLQFPFQILLLAFETLISLNRM